MKNESDSIGGYRLFGAAPKNFLDILRKPAFWYQSAFVRTEIQWKSDIACCKVQRFLTISPATILILVHQLAIAEASDVNHHYALWHELIDGLQISEIMFGLLCNSLLKCQHCIDLHLERFRWKMKSNFKRKEKFFFQNDIYSSTAWLSFSHLIRSAIRTHYSFLAVGCASTWACSYRMPASQAHCEAPGTLWPIVVGKCLPIGWKCLGANCRLAPVLLASSKAGYLVRIPWIFSLDFNIHAICKKSLSTIICE